MQSFDFKKFLPHLLAILGFIVIAALFSYPQLKGEVLKQHDIVSWKGMVKEGQDWYEKTGENVLWSNSMFGGMPTYTHYVPESNNYIYKIQEAITGALGKPISFLFLAMLCFYLLMNTLTKNRWVAIAGSIAYAFSTYNVIIIGAGHETKMLAIAYLPAVLAGLLLLYKGKWWRGTPLLGISLALMISTAHYQIVYYSIFIIAAALIGLFVIAIRNGSLKQYFIASAIAAVTALVAVGPTMPTFLATLEYNKVTMRGGESELTINHDQDKQSKGGGLDKDYAFRWSNGITETFCIMVPGLYGGASSEDVGENSATFDKLTSLGVPEQSAAQVASGVPTYWGDQPFLSGPVYFGAIVCFLFILGLMIVKSPHKWWIVAASAFGIVLSWGSNFSGLNYLLFDTLPGLNKFRTPSMWLVIPQLLFPLLGAWALKDAVEERISREELLKKVKLAVIISAGLCLVIGVGGRMFMSFKSPNDAQVVQQFTQMFGNNPQAANELMGAVREDRGSMAMTSGIVSAVFIVLAGGLMFLFAQRKVKGEVMLIGVAALIAVDLIKTDKNYLNEENYTEEDAYEAAFNPRPVDQQIKQDPDPYYRVLDLTRNTYNDAIQSYHHKTIGGYHPAKIEAYQDMIDVHMGPTSGFNMAVLNMLNTKYLIYPGQGGQPIASPNPEALGNAWFVSDIKWVSTADEEMMSLKARTLGDTAQVPNAFEPAKVAVIRDDFKSELDGYSFGKDSAANISLTKYGLNDLTFESNNSQNGLAVFSDIYYPYGWKAYVDGQETPILKANYLLRAIKIPAGKHKVEFKFHPDSFYKGNTIALITSIILILVAIVSIVMIFKNKGKEEAKA